MKMMLFKTDADTVTNLVPVVERILGESTVRNMRLCHLSFPTILSAAGMRCFLSRIECKDTDIIRAAIKFMDDGGTFE